MFSKLPLIIQSALVRAARSFLQGFGAALLASTASIVDLSTAKAALLGALYAAAAFAWRALLDPSPVPSLVDPAPTAR